MDCCFNEGLKQPLMSFRNDFGEIKLNQITIATRTVLRNYHLSITTLRGLYNTQTWLHEAYFPANKYFQFTSGSTRRLQLFQSARSLITKEAYLTCSMHINTEKKLKTGGENR